MRYSVLYLTLCLVTLYACRDFFEKNLEKSNIIVLSPPDNHVTVNNSVTFWWEKTDAALKYTFQIVSPDFANTVTLVDDAVITDNKYTLTLSPGDYEWRVRAENASSFTDFVVRKLTIDSTSDLSQITLALTSPADSFKTNNFSVNFTWSLISAADNYIIEIGPPGFASTIISQTQTITSYIHDFNSDGEGTYQWRVRAENAGSTTAFSFRTVIVDTTPPDPPVLVTPDNNDTVALNPVTLKWTFDNSSVLDSLYIYTPDSLSIQATYPKAILTDSFDFIGNTSTIYYWRLKSKDQAGNVSTFSTFRKFFIN